MWFVYELSYNSIVFYVGVTHDPATRYVYHLACNEDTTGGVISLIRGKSQLPTLMLVYICSDKCDALQEEEKRIKSYASIKNGLCNREHNDEGNIIKIRPVRGIGKPRLVGNRIALQEYINSVINNYEQKNDKYGCLGYTAVFSLRSRRQGSMCKQLDKKA